MPGIYRLQGVLKQYDWGGNSFLPDLLHMENPGKDPFAEYWLGTHPLGMSVVQTGLSGKPLQELAGPLPFLLKVLDVKEMLSVQVHPDKAGAEREFARENAAGIPLDAAERNYKDPCHKPELMVALEDFWLLHGFKPPEEMVYTLLNVVELREFLPVYNQSGYGGLYRHVMEMPQPDVDRILQPLLSNIEQYYEPGSPDKMDEDYWAARAATKFTKDGHIDRGIFSIYFLNLVHLKKGEGIFQAPGVPHAYLEGRNVEIMANSDNVLRGGLTTKHINVTELLKHVRCEGTHPAIITPASLNIDEVEYPVPVSDFRLGQFILGGETLITHRTEQTEILLLLDGAVELRAGGHRITLQKGEVAALVLPGTDVEIRGLENASLYRASAGTVPH